MRQVKAKRIKREVAEKMYGEDISKHDMPGIYKNKHFKAIYRRAKKNSFNNNQ